LKLLGEPACVAGLLGLAGVLGVGPEQVAAGVGQHCGGPAQPVPVGARDDMDVQVGTLWVTVLLTPMKLPSVPGAAATAVLSCRTRVNNGPASSGGRSATVG
jgi:hypothetical protein